MGGIFTGRPDVGFHQFQRREQGVPTKGTGSTSEWNKQFQPSELPVTMLVVNYPGCFVLIIYQLYLPLPKKDASPS